MLSVSTCVYVHLVSRVPRIRYYIEGYRQMSSHGLAMSSKLKPVTIVWYGCSLSPLLRCDSQMVHGARDIVLDSTVGKS